MLCKTSNEAFNDQDWAFEIKWDGYRAISEVMNNQILLYSRNGLDFSQKFKPIIHSLQIQEHEMILDGEIVAFDDTGKPNYQWIQKIEENPHTPIIYQVFDILWLNGYSTEDLTYLERKDLLKNALQETELVKYHDYVLENGKEFFALSKDLGLEGIIAKKVDSLYKKNIRSAEWLKIKNDQTDEAIICGFIAHKGSRQKFGALILGKYHNNKLVFCGHTGSGFNEKMINEIYLLMKPLITTKSAFEVIPKTNGAATWIKPTLVAEIKFTEITNNKIYRHPIFLRMRDDIEPYNVSFGTSTETKIISMKKKTSPLVESDISKKIGKIDLKLTNHQKVYFPNEGVTKGEVIEYYQSIAKYILPHLKGRPQSMHRYPNGINEMSFFQKDAAETTPDWIETEKVYSESTGKYIQYIICNDKATLAYLNNLGCIELNVWTSQINHPENPDYLVLDLDPSEKNSFDEVIETCLVVKDVLDSIGVVGYPKTSGSTGMHIYIPMGAKYDYDQVKTFGHLLMQMIHDYLPTLTTLERSLQKREKNKIYLDYLQNRKAQTLASVYSLRPKEGCPVSMPLEWNEVKTGILPTDYNIFNALSRLNKKGDLFKPVLGKGIDLLKIIENYES